MKIFSIVLCVKYWGILNCGNWLRIEYFMLIIIIIRFNFMSMLLSNEVFLCFICYFWNFLGCNREYFFFLCVKYR